MTIMPARPNRVFQVLMAALSALTVGVLLFFVLVHQRERLIRQVNTKMIEAATFLELDPDLGWRNRKGASVFFPPDAQYFVRYQIDAEGNRIDVDPATLQGPPITRAVWIVGDSSPFGLGVDAEKSFAAQLRTELRKDGVALKNISVMGYDSGQLKTYFSTRVRAVPVPPDVVILWIGFNDASQFIHELFWRTPFLESVFHARYKKNISDILALCDLLKIRVVEVTLPCFEPHQQLDQLNEWIRSHEGSGGNVVVVDLQRVFAERNDRGLYTNLDDILPVHFHPSERGHALVAQLLLPTVKELLAKR